MTENYSNITLTADKPESLRIVLRRDNGSTGVDWPWWYEVEIGPSTDAEVVHSDGMYPTAYDAARAGMERLGWDIP